MSYDVEWLNPDWSRARVIHHRWFASDRIAEVRLRAVGAYTPEGLWYYVDEDGERVLVVEGAYEGEFLSHIGLQGVLHKKRDRETGRLRRRAEGRRSAEYDAGVGRMWREIPREAELATSGSMQGIAPGDVVHLSSAGDLPAGLEAGTDYVVSRVVPGVLAIRRDSWWRRLYRWIRRHGLDLGAP